MLPLVLVNATAVVGQIGWAHDHLVHQWVVAVLFAATVESIGVYVAYEAHAALLAGDAALKLRWSSYGLALVMGALNYSHYAASQGRPTAAAVIFGLLSCLSPWLWSIRSRSLHRDALRAAGLIDRRSARFALTKWIWFPLRTLRAYRHAVDTGEQQERQAWQAYAQVRTRRKAAAAHRRQSRRLARARRRHHRRRLAQARVHRSARPQARPQASRRRRPDASSQTGRRAPCPRRRQPDAAGTALDRHPIAQQKKDQQRSGRSGVPAAQTNAALLADLYPDRIPGFREVRSALDWGGSRTKAALKHLRKIRMATPADR